MSSKWPGAPRYCQLKGPAQRLPTPGALAAPRLGSAASWGECVCSRTSVLAFRQERGKEKSKPQALGHHLHASSFCWPGCDEMMTMAFW